MGKRGPTPQPTELKLLKGETRESRLNRKTPRPSGGGPIMPRGMRQRARAVWRRQVRAMRLTGVLTVVDGDMLRGYCDAVARYEEAERLLAENGPMVEGARKGELVKNPMHSVAMHNMALVDRLAMHLGFAQGAREGIHVGDVNPPKDSFQAWEEASG